MIGQHRTERLWIPFGYRPRSMMMTINRQIDRVTNQNQRMTQFLLFNCRKISSDHQVKNVIFLKNKRFYQSQMSLISWISRPVSHIMTESKIETKKKELSNLCQNDCSTRVLVREKSGYSNFESWLKKNRRQETITRRTFVSKSEFSWVIGNVP